MLLLSRPMSTPMATDPPHCSRTTQQRSIPLAFFSYNIPSHSSVCTDCICANFQLANHDGQSTLRAPRTQPLWSVFHACEPRGSRVPCVSNTHSFARVVSTHMEVRPARLDHATTRRAIEPGNGRRSRDIVNALTSQATGVLTWMGPQEVPVSTVSPRGAAS